MELYLPIDKRTAAKLLLPEKINEKLNACCNNALVVADDICIYLGRPGVCEQLVWHKNGSGQTVVTVTAMQAHAKETTAYASSNYADRTPPLPPEPANLAIIAHVATKGTFLTPDGNFGISGSQFSKPFNKTQLNLHLEPIHEHLLFDQDFKLVIKHLKTLKSHMATPSISTKNSIIVPSMAGSTEEYFKMKLCHNIFRKRTSKDNKDNDGMTSNLHLPTSSTDFSQTCPMNAILQTGPLPTRSLPMLLKKSSDKTHVIRLLLVYDLMANNSNKIIPPSQYNTKLRGSLVFVHFNLTHYTFGDNKSVGGSKAKDVYVADVTSITLLHDQQEPTTPTKRVSAINPRSPTTPTKRRRGN
ncbi:hypothetical protein NUW54_g5330 [Trametes sanguinea]|uniref:Uncharacterized protein n=1 Tax=Trametes sanguinea TaxID=158606 RepID=A0ACC1PWE8_9APHY|nr:hypothetical protein NUW54_g5330 [Trametes sanguinea]